MPKQRVLLAVPPVSLEEIYGGLAKVGAVAPPLNLLLLAAILRQQGYEPSIVDCPANNLGYADVLRIVGEQQPAVFGITAMTPHILQAARLAQTVKEAHPEMTILLGGAHVSSVPEETMQRLPHVDVGFVGEADHSLPEVLAALASSQPLDSISGIVFRKDGQIVLTDQRRDRVQLDTLPRFAWDLLNGFPLQYKTPLFATHRSPATPILTSRGCPGKCTFCFSGCHKTIATYDADTIYETLLHLRDTYGIQEFMIYDDNFVMYKKNLYKLLNRIIDEKLGLSWCCNARVDMVDEHLLKTMKAAGCWQISFGIESGNQDIIKSLNKKITKDQIRTALRQARAVGIRTVGYFMIGHFRETLETIQETIDFSKSIALDDFRMSFFTPLPGTESYKHAHDFGEFDDDWGKMNLFQPVFIPHGLNRDILVREHKRAIRSFFFRPRIALSYLKLVRNPVAALRGAFFLGQYALSNTSLLTSFKKFFPLGGTDSHRNG